MTATAVPLDIDGTLVDSNYLHVDAWARAFVDVGAQVADWQVHRRLGMDGGRLLVELLGQDHPRADEAKARHADHYAERSGLLRVLPGARELLADLHRRDVTVVLATSAPEDELARLRETLRVEDEVSVVTSGGDVDEAKPAPTVVELALERAGVDAGAAVMVGDAEWDVRAAGAAGVEAVGVLSGGVGADELRTAGATHVYDDAAAVRDDLEQGPLARLLDPDG